MEGVYGGEGGGTDITYSGKNGSGMEIVKMWRWKREREREHGEGGGG